MKGMGLASCCAHVASMNPGLPEASRNMRGTLDKGLSFRVQILKNLRFTSNNLRIFLHGKLYLSYT